MRLDELFKSPNTLRWSKRGDKVSKAAAERPNLLARTKFNTEKDDK